MSDTFQLLINCVNRVHPERKNFKRSSLREDCYILWNVLSFLEPRPPPCGICYRSGKRYKCSQCVFVLCTICAPKLRSKNCPHCRRPGTFPRLQMGPLIEDTLPELQPLISPITPLLPLRERLSQPWRDDPFGPVFLYPPSLPNLSDFSMAEAVELCSFCGRDISSLSESICRCFFTGRSSGNLRREPGLRPRRSLSTDLITFRTRPSCVCSLRRAIGYRCPYGMNCRWIHGIIS